MKATQATNRMGLYGAALVLPGLSQFLFYELIGSQAAWLFAFFGLVLTVAALFFVWVFSDWQEPEPEVEEGWSSFGWEGRPSRAR